MPILVAPTAYHCLACAEGEARHRARRRARPDADGGEHALDAHLEESRRRRAGPLWFQLYVYRDRRVSEALVRRAEAAGYTALVLTVDTPRLGQARARCAQWLRAAAAPAYGELRRRLRSRRDAARRRAHPGLETHVQRALRHNRSPGRRWPG